MDVKNRSLYYYNAKRISRRWPHAIFCYMVSLFTDNAFILFSELQPGLVQNIRLSGRKEFILKLSEELSKPKMELRTNSVSYMLRIIMCEKYGVARPQHPQFPEAPGYAVVGNCHICRRRTRSKCLRCKRSACKECGIRQFLCRDRQMCRRN